MIKIINLSKKFGNVEAIRKLELEIPKGEIFGFLGPNGAGKTTTIKLINGLLVPTTGEIYIDGLCIIKAAAVPPEANQAKALVGYIPDQPYVYEKLTGNEFIDFVGGLYRVSPDELETHREYYFNLFDLQAVADNLCENYSHGMRQKLIMTAALIHKPKVLVVDEPMVGLDPRSARIVKDLFRKLAEQGTTIFLSTHTLEVAEELCHRIGIIQKGELVALGNMEHLEQQMLMEKGSRLEEVFLKITAENEENLII